MPEPPVARELDVESETGMWIDRRLSRFLIEKGVRLSSEDTGRANGYYRPSKRLIALSDRLSGDQRTKTLVHDADYQEIEIARRYPIDPGHYTYLGDWHSHPHGGASLSEKDRKTLLAIATYEAARAPIPLMAILTQDSEWQVSIWRFKRSRFARFGVMGRTDLLRLYPLMESTD